MPADYEMLVSHSPPVYNSYLSDYAPRRHQRDVINKFSAGSCRSASTNTLFFSQKAMSNYAKVPKRPCLVIRPMTEDSSDEDPTSPTRVKKKVVFADDRGMSLTHVRIMTEPSNVPPILSSRFISEVTKGLTAEPEIKENPWEITFAQPASNYLEFRRKLEEEKVSLENVIIKDSEEHAIGTVKVSNIIFEKEVFVRSSSDSWKTHQDTFCQFVDNSIKGISSAYTLYDTFSFKITFPPKTRRIEFCVCFRCGGDEFWDNNDNRNYAIIKKNFHETIAKSYSTNSLCNFQNTDINPKSAIRYNDATHAKIDTWSQFSSWNHLENSHPYW